MRHIKPLLTPIEAKALMRAAEQATGPTTHKWSDLMTQALDRAYAKLEEAHARHQQQTLAYQPPAKSTAGWRLTCPRCSHKQAISPTDPDASQSELIVHFKQEHPEYDWQSLLAITETVEDK